MDKKTYTTKQIADMFHIHPNTVRLYEEIDFITKPARLENRYRVFTKLHIEQVKLIKLALRGEILQNGLRNMAVRIIKETAVCDFNRAIGDTRTYLQMLDKEIHNANEAIEIVDEMIQKKGTAYEQVVYTRKQAAEVLGVTVDTLRNWELNGLITVKRRENGYRIYNQEDIKQLKIIRSLRCANYSLTAILRLLTDLSRNDTVDIKHSIDTPNNMEDNTKACDRLLTTLLSTKEDAKQMLNILNQINRNFKPSI